MNVDIFTLCDNAQEYNGKLVIIGTFNRIYAKSFPTLHPEFALVARVIFNEKERGIHHIDYFIKKNDEEVYIMPPGQMIADTRNAKGKDTAVNVVVKGCNIPIPSLGTYIVSLKVDDKVWVSDLTVSQSSEFE